MGEVLRPAYVRHAFEVLGYQRPSRFVVFIDDMDGCRKVPESIQPRGDRALPGPAGVADSRSVWGMPREFCRAHDRAAGMFLEPVEVEYELLR